MFNKVLIANRGEIACRIIRTCKKINIPTVAIYSEADAQGLHVQEADEAFCVGAARVNESYLKADKIIEIAKEANVDAIHPGYGLLSENANFAKACEEAGITFIGPDANAITVMGSKIEARKTMQAANVPVVPGLTRALIDVDEAVEVAKDMGYPVMLKASAGGGGIGMQVVANEEELRKSFAGNQSRAENFFGDGAMFIEKYIANPRHIEIQLLADKEGNTISLWERDCSVQRRHQKVIEEAPSPFLDEKTRKEMSTAAINAAKAINYYNAGTVEFLVDENKDFYFLEMNTRLQVEHPVTEEITGFDIVEEQLKIAANQTLTIKQEDVPLKGHAIEVRIYAEDPVRFFPSPGTISEMKIPYMKGIRHELGVQEGMAVTPFYDPMIAKCVATGETRAEAIRLMQEALNHYQVEGIKTNIPMLQTVLDHEEFKQGNATTDFVQKYLTKKKEKKK
ncbi:biotin carboxylase [Lottiidibacillus patelloidae]|uniref:biotin carboxylase n=1 Tax=Lottiidibacillus patelloidae TaxID=2670334 RepID=A0A263BU07_9BACI|nr:acetyl-CoA carboxylase biotin carboxylase subunit [Lottiidibacillus patelloidae]OZM57231.1 biotin carboxylase [Lottiidibacillus patelloidae]